MQSQPVPHRDDISHLSEIFRREVKLKMNIVYCRIYQNWKEVSSRHKVCWFPTYFTNNLPTAHPEVYFKSFPIGKDRERDKVSLGRIGSIYPRQRANLVTINLNNQSTNNQLVPPTLARHLHSLPEKKISFFMEISWRKEVHVWSYLLWTNRICLFAKQTLLQYAFNQNTMMLTLNDEKDDGKFMETGETLVKY